MTFSEFLNAIFTPINPIINLTSNVINGLMDNYIFLIILYVLITYLVIENLGQIINLIKNMFGGKNVSNAKNTIFQRFVIILTTKIKENENRG